MKTQLPSILLAAVALTGLEPLRADVTHAITVWEGGSNPVINNPAPYSVPDTFSYDGGTVSSFASYAGQGFGQAAFQLQVTNASGSSYGQASAAPNWTDTLTINAPGRTGESGTFTFRLVLNASASVSNPYVLPVGHPSLSVNYLVNGAGVSSSQWWGVSINPPSYADHVIQSTASFVFGTPFSLSAGFTMSARESGSSLPNGELATFHGNASLAWNGIPEVFDSTSAPVTNFTTISGSGIDYTNTVVPEPCSALLLAVGTVALMRRRPRKS